MSKHKLFRLSKRKLAVIAASSVIVIGIITFICILTLIILPAHKTVTKYIPKTRSAIISDNNNSSSSSSSSSTGGSSTGGEISSTAIQTSESGATTFTGGVGTTGYESSSGISFLCTDNCIYETDMIQLLDNNNNDNHCNLLLNTTSRNGTIYLTVPSNPSQQNVIYCIAITNPYYQGYYREIEFTPPLVLPNGLIWNYLNHSLYNTTHTGIKLMVNPGFQGVNNITVHYEVVYFYNGFIGSGNTAPCLKVYTFNKHGMLNLTDPTPANQTIQPYEYCFQMINPLYNTMDEYKASNVYLYYKLLGQTRSVCNVGFPVYVNTHIKIIPKLIPSNTNHSWILFRYSLVSASQVITPNITSEPRIYGHECDRSQFGQLY